MHHFSGFSLRLRAPLKGVLKRIFASGVILLSASTVEAAFDHSHAQWDTLTKKHVAWLPGGHASQVDYKGFRVDRQALKSYLDGVSSVNQADHDGWSKSQKLAFLINAYNAFTIELVLTGHPGVKSIRDLGSLIRSPREKKARLEYLDYDWTLNDRK